MMAFDPEGIENKIGLAQRGAAEEDDPRIELRSSREMVKAGPQGMLITNLAEGIEYAKAMAKAIHTVPEHLHGNIGDCLAIIDIATRAGLSPYMVAQKTYVQNKVLCYESQLYHAFVQGFGLLIGDLVVEHEGQGGDLVCHVTGILRSDPHRPRTHESPPLREVHPGFVLRKGEGQTTSKRSLTYAEGAQMLEDGLEQGTRLFSAGSPLWTRKPRVQLFYDTSRDWVRMFAPRATLGVYTPDELQDYAEDMSVSRETRPNAGGKVAELTDRLKRSRAERHGRGFDGDHIEREVSKTIEGTINADPNGEAQQEEGNGKTNTGTASGNDVELSDAERHPDGENRGDSHDAADDGVARGAVEQAGGRAAGDGVAKEEGQQQADLLGSDLASARGKRRR
jgi:hypothetical protein